MTADDHDRIPLKSAEIPTQCLFSGSARSKLVGRSWATAGGPLCRDLVIGGQIRHRAIVVQRKTGKPVQFELMGDARASLLAWLDRRGGTVDDYVFPSRVDRTSHLSTRQYARLVDEWVVGTGLRREEYGTHSLRRTKASIIYKATGNLRAVQILLGHTKIENTVRYLGVDVEDALALAEATEI